MKKSILFLGAFLSSQIAFSQVGINTENPDPSSNLTVAPLDWNKTAKGTLLSALTTAQRTTIAFPATGLIVYDTDLKCLMTNNGIPSTPIWKCIGSYEAPSISNIYTTDGTLATNRLVKISNGNTLSFKTEGANLRETKIDRSYEQANSLSHTTTTGTSQILVSSATATLNFIQNQNEEAQIMASGAGSEGLILGTGLGLSKPVAFFTNGTERMTIASDGKISMKPLPSTVTGSLLFVNGSIETANFTYPDYVFEDYFNGFSELKSDYSFKSLKEVEVFINRNKHLPGVTGIKHLRKNEKGDYIFNLSEVSIQMLEKVEELFLHTIEQQKLIDQQQAEIKTLQEDRETTKARLEKLEKIILEADKKDNNKRKI